jgi:glutaryl-CoA dehydrogenase
VAVVVVWAGDVEDGQVKGFLVEKGTPGYNARKIEHKVPLRAVWQAQIELAGCRVPAENKLPGANTIKDAARILVATRLSCAWGALGAAAGAFDAALSYAKKREQFGKPLAGFQIVQQRLVRMLSDLTAMQLYCLQMTRLAEQGQLGDTLAGLGKLHNTTKARAILAEARDLLGGNGILLDFHVVRHMVDLEAIHTFEGTETIQTLIVGRGISAFA